MSSNLTILRGLSNLHNALLQHVAEVHCLEIADSDGHSLRLRRDVVVRCILRYCVSTGLQIGNGNLTVRTSGHSLAVTVRTRDREAHAANLAIL